MNFPGRIIGGTLVAIAMAWILNIAGVFPFNSRTNNQIATDGASNPSSDQQNRSGTQNFGTGTQGNGNTAQLPNTTNHPNTGSNGTLPVNSDPNANPPAPAAPIVRGAW